MSDLLVQTPVLIFTGMVAAFSLALLYISVTDARHQ